MSKDKEIAITGYYLTVLVPYFVFISLYIVDFIYKIKFDEFLKIIFISIMISLTYAFLEFSRAGFNISLLLKRRIYLSSIDKRITFSGGYGEPIALALILILLWLFFFFYYDKRHPKKNFLYVIGSILMVFTALLTATRRVFLIFLFQISFIYLFNNKILISSIQTKIIKKRIKKFLLFGIFLILVLLPIYYLRSTGKIAEGRTNFNGISIDINSVYYFFSSLLALKVLISNIFWGIGLFNGNYYWNHYLSDFPNFPLSNQVHANLNVIFIPYSSLWIHLGLIPYLVYIYMIYTIFKRARIKAKFEFMNNFNSCYYQYFMVIQIIILSLFPFSLPTIMVPWKGTENNIINPDYSQPFPIYGIWTAIFFFISLKILYKSTRKNNERFKVK